MKLHTITLLSDDPLDIRLPSDENEIEVTWLEWPIKLKSLVFNSKFQTEILSSEDPAAIYWPQGEKATDFT